MLCLLGLYFPGHWLSHSVTSLWRARLRASPKKYYTAMPLVRHIRKKYDGTHIIAFKNSYLRPPFTAHVLYDFLLYSICDVTSQKQTTKRLALFSSVVSASFFIRSHGWIQHPFHDTYPEWLESRANICSRKSPFAHKGIIQRTMIFCQKTTQ